MFYKKNLDILNKFHSNINITNVIYKENIVKKHKDIPYSIILNNKECLLNSKYNPEKEVARLFRNKNFSGKILLIYGFGFGYILNYLLNIDYLSIKKIIIIDVNPKIFVAALHHLDLTQSLKIPNLSLLISNNNDYIYNSITNFFSNENIDDSEFIIHKPSFNIIPDEFLKLKNILNKVSNNFQYENKFDDVISDNFKNNYNKINKFKCISEFFSNYKNSFTQGILVGAGPSLDYHFDKILRIKNRNPNTVLIAVDAANYPMLNNNYEVIHPDIVLSVDPQQWTTDFFSSNYSYKSKLIFSLFSYKKVNEFNFSEKYYFVPESHYFIKKNNITSFNDNMLQGGSSVSVYALEILIKLGCLDIFLFGQDFSFPNFKIYSKLTKRIINYINNCNKFSSVETNILNSVVKDVVFYNNIPTLKNLLDYKREFELLIKSNNQINYYNFIHNSLKIDGCENIS